jgi:hypothetical protein
MAESSTAPRLTNTYTLRWDGWDYDYPIPLADRSIVIGGARAAFIHDLDKRYNVSDNRRVLEGAARYFDGYMQKNFVGWEDSNAYTDHVWTGSECIIPLRYANASLTRPLSSVMGYLLTGRTTALRGCPWRERTIYSGWIHWPRNAPGLLGCPEVLRRWWWMVWRLKDWAASTFQDESVEN